MAPRVLFVLTSHAEISGIHTGWFLPEFAHPFYVLESVASIEVSSLKGGEAPLNQQSIAMFRDDDESQKFLAQKTELWTQTKPLESYLGKTQDFDAIFYVGAGGPMFDLATSETSHQVIREFVEAGKIVSAVCHGSIALAQVKLTDLNYLIDGLEVTGFSNEEEEETGMKDVLPFFLETEMTKNVGANGRYVKAASPWGALVTSGTKGESQILTGQNPASAKPLAIAVRDAMLSS